MKPLIKWAGGKSNEFKYIENLIPKSHDRYIEPFFGGGAVFFALEPKKAIVNDLSEDLVSFYKLLKNPQKRELFKEELERYVKYWERVKVYLIHFGNSIIEIYNKYKNDKISEKTFENEIKILFKERIVPFNGLFTKNFCIDQENLLNSIESNLISKLKRVKNKIDTENDFSNPEIMKNIETAFRSGFYMHFRDIMNREKGGELKVTQEKKIANYYFVREFCYGGMFRFNASGEFNVPYGGNAYNKKDFKIKVEHVFSEEVENLLRRTIIQNLDFEEFLNKLSLNENDFIFLDPPYDSEFSEYEENPFTKKDQERLANYLINTKAKFILIIKETPFIKRLYGGKRNVEVSSFDKTYSFGIKGRNEKEVKHLMVHNLRKIERQEKLLVAIH